MSARMLNIYRPGRRAAQGFTLVELMVSLAIFSLLMGGLALLFSTSVKAFRESTARVNQFVTARAAFDFMTRDIESAFQSKQNTDRFELYGTSNRLTFIGINQPQPESVYAQDFTDSKGIFHPAASTMTTSSDIAGVTYAIEGEPQTNIPLTPGLKFDPNQTRLLRVVSPDADNLDDYILLGNELSLDVSSMFQAREPDPFFKRLAKINGELQYKYSAALRYDNTLRKFVFDHDLYASLSDFELASGIIEQHARNASGGIDMVAPALKFEFANVTVNLTTGTPTYYYFDDYGNRIEGFRNDWDSRPRSTAVPRGMGRLPQVVRVTMTVVDPESMTQLKDGYQPDPGRFRTFRTTIYLRLAQEMVTT